MKFKNLRTKNVSYFSAKLIMFIFLISITAITNKNQLIWSNQDFIKEKTYVSSSVNDQFLINISLITPQNGAKIRSNTNISVKFGPIPSHIGYRWDGYGVWTFISGVEEINITNLMTEGNHFLVVRANTSNDEWSEKSWAFNIDDHTIFFTLNNPEEYSVLKSGIFISVTASPEPTGILYAWDEDTLSAQPRSLPVGDGLHVYRVHAEDFEGNWYSIEYAFYTDDTPPLVVLSEVNNSQLPSGHIIKWPNPIEDLDKVLYKWNSGVTETPNFDSEQNQYEFITPNGSSNHGLTIYVNDSINNNANYYFNFSTKIRIDLVIHPYEINVQNYEYTYCKVYSQPNVSLEFTFTDTPYIVYYNWWIDSATKGINSTTLNRTHLTGEKKLQVFANDSKGNWDNFTLICIIDETPPEITGHHTNKSELLKNTTIGFELSEERILHRYYSWDGNPNGSNRQLPDEIGIHHLNLSIQDWALNWNRFYFVYYTKYNVTLLNINDRDYLEGNYQIEVSILPSPTTVTFQWDNQAQKVTIDPLPAISANHTLNISTQDQNGKLYHDVFSFITVLSVYMITPVENIPSRSVPVVLSMSEIPMTTLYAWDNESFSTILHQTPTSHGDHWLHVNVENSNLPATEWFLYHFHIIIDNESPEIVNIEPNNNSRINKKTEINIDFNENSSLNYCWNNGTFTDINNLNGTNIIIDTPDHLQDGINNITFNVTDIARNIIIIKMSYNVDNTPIEIDLNNPNNATNISSTTLLNITFSELPVKKYFFIENHSTMNMTEIPQIPYSNTSIRIYVYAQDGLNWASETYIFTIEHMMVNVFINEPINKSIITNRSEFNITYINYNIKQYFQWNGNENQTKLIVPDKSGEYNFTIWVQDISEQWIVRRYTYIVDNDGPSIITINPQTSELKAGKTIKFNFSELVSNVTYKWDSEDNYTLISIDGSLNFSMLVPTKTGNLSLYISLTDILGNQNQYLLDCKIKKSGNENYFSPQNLIGMGVLSLFALIVTVRGILHIRKSEI